MENLKNRNMSTTWIIIGSIVVLLAVILVGMYFSYNNKEINLRKRAVAQEQKIESIHDKMWKVLQESAGVAKEYSAQFDSIYTHIMEGRYSGNTASSTDGSLMKWIQESNPEFSPELYANLQAQIEALRSEFNTAQVTMADIQREHNALLETFPSRWFISDDSPIEYVVISSANTKQVMLTREDNQTISF